MPLTGTCNLHSQECQGVNPNGKIASKDPNAAPSAASELKLFLTDDNELDASELELRDWDSRTWDKAMNHMKEKTQLMSKAESISTCQTLMFQAKLEREGENDRDGWWWENEIGIGKTQEQQMSEEVVFTRS